MNRGRGYVLGKEVAVGKGGQLGAPETGWLWVPTVLVAPGMCSYDATACIREVV